MQNIELKARHASLADAEAIATKIGARRVGTMHQRDTYFRCSNGRLKLRERWSDDRQCVAELIGYHRVDATHARPSDYSILPVPDGSSLGDLLADTLGVLVTVTKRRTLFLYENVRIHLDDVDRLGTFLEFEAVLDASNDETEGQAKVEWLTATFGLTPAQIVPTSYSDLLAGASTHAPPAGPSGN